MTCWLCGHDDGEVLVELDGEVVALCLRCWEKVE